jgi:hypothetical protein
MPASPTPAPSVRDELELLRDVLREASDAVSWTAARRILVRELEDKAKQTRRK